MRSLTHNCDRAHVKKAYSIELHVKTKYVKFEDKIQILKFFNEKKSGECKMFQQVGKESKNTKSERLCAKVHITGSIELIAGSGRLLMYCFQILPVNVKTELGRSSTFLTSLFRIYSCLQQYKKYKNQSRNGSRCKRGNR